MLMIVLSDDDNENNNNVIDNDNNDNNNDIDNDDDDDNDNTNDDIDNDIDNDSPLLIWIQSADHSKHNEGWSVCIIHEMFWAWTLADIPQPIDTCSLKISCIQCMSNATYMCEIYLSCVYCIGNVPANIHSNSQYLTHFFIQGGL